MHGLLWFPFVVKGFNEGVFLCSSSLSNTAQMHTHMWITGIFECICFDYLPISLSPAFPPIHPIVLQCAYAYCVTSAWISEHSEGKEIGCILFHQWTCVDPRFKDSFYFPHLYLDNPFQFTSPPVSYNVLMQCAHLWTYNLSRFCCCNCLCNCAWNNGWISNKWLTDFILGALDVPLRRQ